MCMYMPMFLYVHERRCRAAQSCPSFGTRPSFSFGRPLRLCADPLHAAICCFLFLASLLAAASFALPPWGGSDRSWDLHAAA